MKKILILLGALLVGTAAEARECVPQTEMQEIARNFPQFSNLAGAEYCYDGSHMSHLIAGIMFMRKTQFEPMDKSRDDLFSGRFANNWYQYFIGRINKFEIDENCPKGVAAYVYAFGGRTMYACTMMLSADYTALDRASVFMHEARHIDGYPHVTCRTGARAGLQGACDTRISDGGSYAVSVETYAQLAKFAVGVHPALRSYARSSAVVYADEAFEQKVRVEQSKRLLVVGADKSLLVVGGKGEGRRLGSLPLAGRVTMRAQHMILFPEDRNQNARFVFARGEGEIEQKAGNQANEYNEMSPAERAKVVGIHIGAQWDARVFTDKVRMACDPRAHRSQEIAFSGDKPIGVIYPEGYDRAFTKVHLMMESGAVMEAGCKTKSAYLIPSDLQLGQKYTSLLKVDNLTLGVDSEGALWEVNGKTARPYAVPGLKGSRALQVLPNSVVDFFNET